MLAEELYNSGLGRITGAKTNGSQSAAFGENENTARKCNLMILHQYYLKSNQGHENFQGRFYRPYLVYAAST